MMKIRLRSFESKETLKIEVPNSCTLSQLKQTLVQALHISPDLDSIRLSLNRKDDLVSDGGDLLHSLGIAAGDLIYFSLEQPAEGMSSISQIVQIKLSGSTISDTQNIIPGVQNFDFAGVEVDSRTKESVNREEQMEGMEVDDEANHESDYETDGIAADKVAHTSFSAPGFLRKVFMEELWDDIGKDHKLIVIATHAIMLEAGFAGFDNTANMVIDGVHFRDNKWPSNLFRLSLHYTLSEYPKPGPARPAKSIVLKFQSLGKFITVYGMLENVLGKRGTHRVQLNEEHIVPFLNAVWANIRGDGIGSMDPENEVFDFWRTVKDNLALPLLFDLCDELGLQLPPCFMQLPTDLKFKILEFLPGVDIAKTSCVCSELRYLSSNDDLWKLKFVEELGIGEVEVPRGRWKTTFASVWEGLESRRKVGRGRRMPLFWPDPHMPQLKRTRYPSPFMVARAPRIIGGDYDISPSLDDVGGVRRFGAWSSRLSPQCHFGVLGDGFL